MDLSASDLNLSNDVKQHAEEALRTATAEIDEAAQKSQDLTATKRAQADTQQPMFQTSLNQMNSPEAIQQGREEWAKTQISDINSQTKREIENLEALRSQQQELYHAQLAEKNEVWEKVVLQRREEAAQLRAMITHLSSAISVARNEAKADIDQAKRKAAESTKQIRQQREKQLQQIAELTSTLRSEKKQFEFDLDKLQNDSQIEIQQKQEQIARLKKTLSTLQAKLKEKESVNEAKLRQQIKGIRELRTKLQQLRENENERQNELMSMQKLCASLSRKISARKDEAASLKRQLAMLDKENEELQGEIMKTEAQIFPSVFNYNK